MDDGVRTALAQVVRRGLDGDQLMAKAADVLGAELERLGEVAHAQHAELLELRKMKLQAVLAAGIGEAERGETVDLGSFARYADDRPA